MCGIKVGLEAIENVLSIIFLLLELQIFTNLMTENDICLVSHSFRGSGSGNDLAGLFVGLIECSQSVWASGLHSRAQVQSACYQSVVPYSCGTWGPAFVSIGSSQHHCLLLQGQLESMVTTSGTTKVLFERTHLFGLSHRIISFRITKIN